MDGTDLRKEYDRKIIIKCMFILISFVVLFLLVLFSVSVGTADITMSQVKNAIIGGIFGNSEGLDITLKEEKIILLLRLPRVILAMLAGAGLSIAGTVMQGITRNPLVSPFTIGLSSGAAFGATLSIVLGIGFFPGTAAGMVLNAFASAFLCAILVYSIASKVGMSPEALILTGIALSYLFGAFTATLQFIANENQLSAVVQWTFGNLNGANWTQVIIVGAILLVTFPILFRYSWIFNAMASGGDEFIKGLGINPKRVRIFSGMIVVLITASIISFTGVIGFVGLVAPHMARIVVGSDHRFLTIYSGIFGAILLLISDTIGRTLLSPLIIPVGIVISYLGVPLFINLIITRRKEYF